MNELEKCMAGEYYDCHDKIFLDFKTQARELLKEYNSLAYEQKQEKTGILKQLFGSIGTNVSVGLPFLCDYGLKTLKKPPVYRFLISFNDIFRDSLIHTPGTKPLQIQRDIRISQSFQKRDDLPLMSHELFEIRPAHLYPCNVPVDAQPHILKGKAL